MLNIALINSIITTQIDKLSAVYLYGSFADGTASKNSDVDIAILANEPISALVLFELRFQLESQIGKTVDLIDLTQANTVLVNQICSTGERILTLDNKHADSFEAYQLKEWLWLNEHRQAIIQEMIKDE